MLVYFNSGFCEYKNNLFPVAQRDIWEFQCNLSGQMDPILPVPTGAPESCSDGRRKLSTITHPPAADSLSCGVKTINHSASGPRRLWVFPPHTEYGWKVNDKVERLVFHFTAVPGELENQIPEKGYYQVDLEDEDCERLRKLAEQAEEMGSSPTDLLFLKTRILVGELSLIALREVDHSPLPGKQIASNKTERALAYYREHIAEDPSFEEISAAVGICPTHLRRLFHKARGESPHQTLNRIRMEKAEQLLRETDDLLSIVATKLGFSDGSALSRAVKTHFGRPPSDLRKDTTPIRDHRGQLPD